MDKGRISSLVIAVCWLIAAFVVGPLERDSNGRNALPAIVGLLTVALGLIWYGDELGDYVGTAGRGDITQRTPGCMVKFFGWVMLLGMVTAWFYQVISR